jgi:V/A-type H+-transporting ATPase subunit E
METINLEQLTKKIYQEAIGKAEADAKEIINQAKAKSDKIISDAQTEAEQNILLKARKKAELLKTSTESELHLNAKRLISDLKLEITNLITNRILKENIKEVLVNPSFFKEIIVEVTKHWGKEDVLDLHLPQNTREKIDNGFKKEISTHVKDLKLTFDDKIKSGFKIVNTNDSYQISFTEDDFIAFFQSYLSDKTRQLLFEKDS